MWQYQAIVKQLLLFVTQLLLNSARMPSNDDISSKMAA